MSLRLSALLASLLLIAGCASPPPVHRALAGGAAPVPSDTEVILVLPQRELVRQLPAKGPAPEPVASQALMAPLQKVVADQGFESRLEEALDGGLAQVPRLRARPLRVLRAGDDASLRQQLGISTAAAVLLIDARYRLSPELAELELLLQAQLLPRGETLRKSLGLKAALAETLQPQESLYRNTLRFRSRLPAAGPDPAANRGQWLIDGGHPLREALDDGRAELAAALAADLRASGGGALGPALTDGYWRERLADGSLLIRGQAGTGQSLHTVVVAPDTVPMAAPVAIPEPPPEPLVPVEPEALQGLGDDPVSSYGPPSLAVAPRLEAQPGTPPPAPAPALSPTLALALASTPAPPSPPTLAIGGRGRLRVSSLLQLQPLPESATTATLSAGTAVTIVGKTTNLTGEWLYLEAGADSGWLPAEDVAPLP